MTRFPRWRASYFRTSNGAEIDLILTKGLRTIAIEIKASTTPRLTKGFWNSIEYLSPDQVIVVAPVKEEYPIADKVMVTPLTALKL